MNWFAKFEKKFSKYAIKNLMFYIIVLYAIGFVMNTFFNGLYDAYFSLDFAMIFKGQVWRLFTFILQPPSNSIIFVVFVLYFYYLIGSVLEKYGARSDLMYTSLQELSLIYLHHLLSILYGD